MMAWAIDTLIASTALMVLVLLVRKPFARLFGARAAFALWLVPALRMVIPPIPATAQIVPAPTFSAGSDYLLIPVAGPDLALAGAATLAGILWAAGAIGFLAIQWARHRLFLRSALSEARPIAARCGYPVLASPFVDGPVAIGLFRPLILVPADFEDRFTPGQQRLALLHEELHHRRGDLWATTAALILTAAHWFNPIAHFAARAARRDMEAACDARLLQETGRSAAAAYADTILRSTSRAVPGSLCALTSIDELKRRLTMLNLNEGPVRRALGLGAVGLFAFAGAATAADNHKKVETHEVKKIEIRHSDGKHSGKLEMHKMGCAGEKFELVSEGGTGDRKEKMKLLLCAQKGESLIPALEKAAADIEKRDDLPADRKADMLGKLRAKIAELRSKG